VTRAGALPVFAGVLPATYACELIRQHHREKGERVMSVIEFPARNLSPLRKRLTIVMREMMTENYPVSDIAKAWLQAGHEFAANVGDEEFLDSMA
jgi:hypothetical protein